MSNRKLIRPNLSELKERIQGQAPSAGSTVQDRGAAYEPTAASSRPDPRAREDRARSREDQARSREEHEGSDEGFPGRELREAPEGADRQDRQGRTAVYDRPETQERGGDRPQKPFARRKQLPPEATAAEAFYYLKQMNSRTPMVVVLMDGEVLHGIIEWYDRYCIKVNRDDAPNLLVFKQQVKYMYKAEEARGKQTDADEFDRA